MRFQIWETIRRCNFRQEIISDGALLHPRLPCKQIHVRCKQMGQDVWRVGDTMEDGGPDELMIGELQAKEHLHFRRWMHKRGIGLIGCEIRNCPGKGARRQTLN